MEMRTGVPQREASVLTIDDPGVTDAGSGSDQGRYLTEIAAERAQVDRLYRRLDRMRQETLRLREHTQQAADGTPGGRVEQDIAVQHHNARLASLNLAEDRLVFGRIDRLPDEDLAEGAAPLLETMHIGRLGMFSDDGEHTQMLMDWRAPSARPFYVATAGKPLGLIRRRHLRVRRRELQSLTDEYLDISPAGLAALGVTLRDVEQTSGPGGESTLLDALNAPRTGRMADIVETIQAEQDEIIRSDRTGVLVVQGGPGTGKTAVALHRAAYLLYTYREQLANRGVLIVGPNRTFLDYIGSVLPSLGENAVVLRTLGELFPGVTATAHDLPEVARIKGRRSMAGVLANAVLDRQRVPRTPQRIATGLGPVELSPQALRTAQGRAWASRLPHNPARAMLVRSLIRNAAEQIALRQSRTLGGRALLSPDEMRQLRIDLASDEALATALSGWWPQLTPARLLSDLFTSPERLAVAAGDLSPRDREVLLRTPGSAWTISDVPLLDEAAELLGDLVGVEPARQRQQENEYADGVLDMLVDDSTVAEGDGWESMLGLVRNLDLSAVRGGDPLIGSTADRAGQDREWTYGHVVVDEAQELSPMAWRMLLRRCPARSMTVVGDVAQTSDPAGATSWQKTLKPLVGPHWRMTELTVNYRTPAEISSVADAVLARINPTLRPPVAIRSTGVQPWWLASTRATLAADVADMVAKELTEASPERHLAVLAPRALQSELRTALHTAAADDPTALLDRTVVLSVPQAKGLEFDIVVLVEPELIQAESPRGLGDVYVALTRATQRLGVVHTGRRPWMAPRAETGSEW